MMNTRLTFLSAFARASRTWRGRNPVRASETASPCSNVCGKSHAQVAIAMKHSVIPTEAGNGRSALSSNEPNAVPIFQPLRFVARITQTQQDLRIVSRSLVVVEKGAQGWGQPSAQRTRRGFTRVELCACLAAVTLLLLLALPALATSRSRSDVAQCLNNLRLAGRAVQMWGANHQNQPPWRTLQQDGGLMTAPGFRPGNVWFDFLALSNELTTPRILACPSDPGVVVAKNFSFDPGSGGYASPSHRHQATSYLLNLHSQTEYPEALLFSDRNVKFQPGAFGCSLRVNNIVSFYPQQTQDGWTNLVHGLEGNIVRMDGSVSQTTSDELRAAFAKSPDENGSPVHVLKPQRNP